MAHSDSPWIIKLHYAFQDAQFLYMAMDYMAGGCGMGAEGLLCVLLLPLPMLTYRLGQAATSSHLLTITIISRKTGPGRISESLPQSPVSDALTLVAGGSFYTAEVVLAIEALHSMGYAHRDLKPHNILIDPQGHLKVGRPAHSHRGLT